MGGKEVSSQAPPLLVLRLFVKKFQFLIPGIHDSVIVWNL